MTDQEKRDDFERKQEEIRQKATRVCEIYAEGTPIDQACRLENLPVSAFFRAKRDNPDIAKHFTEAKEVLAELRVAKMDDLKEQMLAGSVDPQTFSAAIKSDQWVISRLRPDLFGTKTTVDVSGTIEHSPAKLLARMTDEQLLELARAPVLPSPKHEDAPADTAFTPAVPQEETIDAEYDEITEPSETFVVDREPHFTYNDPVDRPATVTSAGPVTHAEPNERASHIAGFSVDFSALGGDTSLGGHNG